MNPLGFSKKRKNQEYYHTPDKKRKISDIEKKEADLSNSFHKLTLSSKLSIEEKKDQITKLLDAGQNINGVNAYGQNVLHRIILAKHISLQHKLTLLHFLIQRGANILQLDSKSSPLHLLASNYTSSFAKILIRSSKKNDPYFDINLQNHQGETPLHWTITSSTRESEKIKMIDLLTANGARIDQLGNSEKNNGAAPLHLATTKNVFIVQQLIKSALKYKQHFDINIQDFDGQTPLHWAIASNHDDKKVEMLDLLISHGARIDLLGNPEKYNGASPLHLTTMKNSLIAQTAIECSIRNNLPFNINIQDFEGQTPLHWAISSSIKDSEKIRIIDLFISYGAEHSMRGKQETNNGASPLHLATIQNSLILGSLIDSCMKNNMRLNIDIKDFQEQTPLHWAVILQVSESEKKKIIKSLISCDARIDVPSSTKATPLHLASLQNNATVKYLIELSRACNIHFDINPIDDQGRTPLHWAITSVIDDGSKIKIIETFLKHGACLDMNCAGNAGVSPLHLATLQNSCITQFIIEYAQTHGLTFDINIRDLQGRTPLFWAITSIISNEEKLKLLDLLITHGALLNIIGCQENYKGASPLHLAVLQNSAIVEMIIDRSKNNPFFDIDIADTNERSPLHWAVSSTNSDDEKIKIIDLLIAQGAKIEKLNSERVTIFHEAAKVGAGETINHILRTYLETNDGERLINEQDIRKRTAFHWALRRTFGPQKHTDIPLLSFNQLFNVLTAFIDFHPDCYTLKDEEDRSICDWIENYEKHSRIEKWKIDLLRKIVAACDPNNHYIADVLIDKNKDKLQFTVDSSFGYTRNSPGPILEELMKNQKVSFES